MTQTRLETAQSYGNYASVSHAILRNFNDRQPSSVRRRHNNAGVRGANEVADDVQAEDIQGEHSGTTILRWRGRLRGRFRGTRHHRGDLRHVGHWSVLISFPSTFLPLFSLYLSQFSPFFSLSLFRLSLPSFFDVCFQNTWFPYAHVRVILPPPVLIFRAWFPLVHFLVRARTGGVFPRLCVRLSNGGYTWLKQGIFYDAKERYGFGCSGSSGLGEKYRRTVCSFGKRLGGIFARMSEFEERFLATILNPAWSIAALLLLLYWFLG